MKGLMIISFIHLLSGFTTFSHSAIQNQTLPEIKHVSAVAHDVICIEVDEGRLLPIIQIPYHAEPSDIITINSRTLLGEPRSVGVERNGRHLGDLVGKDRKTLVILERVVGVKLDSAAAELNANYMIHSFGHKEYKRGISTLKVWRKTKPTDWAIDTGWPGKAYTARHYLYLKLPHSLKTGEAYLLQFPGLNLKKTNIHYTHDPINNRSDAVHVSQIGFRADDPCKYAYLSTWMGSGGGYTYPDKIEFSIIDENSNQRVFSGKGEMQWKGDVPEGIGSKNVNHSKTDVIRLDFSAFNVSGRFRLSVEGIGCSYPFSIGEEETWKNAFLTSLKGLYVHRSGLAMGPPYSDFVRPRSFHPDDGVEVFHSTCPLINSGNGLNALGTDKNNFGNLCAGKTDIKVDDAWGGLMDAGDWDRRIQHLDVSRLLLELMLLSPDYFMNVSLNIPESNNELPDIVDEALWGLDVYRRLQLRDGGIRGGIESSEHPAGDLSWHDQFINMTYAPDHWSGFIYAGVAARAAFVLKMLGEYQKAGVWEESSVKAMEWSEIVFQKWIADTNYENIRERAKNEVLLERNLAAVELYRLTENNQWHEIYLENQSFQNNNSNAAFIYTTLNKSLVKEKAQRDALDYILKEADLLVELSGKSAYGITTAIPGKALGGWAATYSIPASTTLVRAHFLSGEPDYLKTVIRSSLFSAGANPMNLVLTTGIGENPVIHPLHIDSRFTGQPAPVGITVCGPCEIPVFGTTDNVHGIRINRECIPDALQWPSAESYFDVYRWASMNEYTVDNTMGPSAFIWGYLASRKQINSR
jgi:endoglucanase